MNGAVHLICGIIVFHTLDTASTGSLESISGKQIVRMYILGGAKKKRFFLQARVCYRQHTLNKL
jgi:hypothetical protein